MQKISASGLTAEKMAKDMYAGFRLAELTQIMSDVYEGLVRDMYGHFDRALYAYKQDDKRRINLAIQQARNAAATFKAINRYTYHTAKEDEQEMLFAFSDFINDMILPFYPFGVQNPDKVKEYKKSFSDCMKRLVSLNETENKQYAEILSMCKDGFEKIGR